MEGASPFERFTAEGRALPRLPIPPLEATLARYVGSVAALASPAEFRSTALNALRFLQPGGATSGPALHQALLRRAAEKGALGKSYLIDWWNSLMYTAWREPLPVNVSYWYALGSSTFSALDSAAAGAGLARPSSYRAAALVLGAAAFRDRVWTRGEALEGGKVPLDGSMFRYVFHACRLPREGDDGVRVYDGAGPTAPSDAIVVSRRGRLYAVSLAASASAGGGRVSWAELTRRIEAAVAHADAAFAAEGTGAAAEGVGLGALTAGHRDTWAAAAAALTGGAAPARPSHGVGVRADPAAELLQPAITGAESHNLRVLTTIESALLVLCMDECSGESVEARSLNLLVGSPHNRWFDKAAQFVVDERGGAGFIGEHSHSDGMPTAVMMDWVAKHLISVAQPSAAPLAWRGGGDLVRSLQAGVPLDNRILPGDACGAASGAETVVALEWAAPLPVLAWLGVARAEVSALAASHRLVAVRSEYGRGVVSKRFKASPDAWAQMALQLAYWRWKGPQGAPVATYEPAHVRRFLWGRTACIRAASVASAEWVAAFDSPATPGPRVAHAKALVGLLRRACAAHVEASQAAAAGLDADRHLLGLKLLWAEATAAAPGGGTGDTTAAAFFGDPLFSRSKTWLLSTSNLTVDCVENWGWGEVTPGGLGVAYSTREDALAFNVVGEAATGVEAFAAALTTALRDMAAVAEAATQADAAVEATPRL